MRRLVDDIPEIDQAAKSRDAVGDAFQLQSPHFGRVIGQPAWFGVIPGQRVPLRRNPMFLTPLGSPFGVLVLRLIAARLIRRPVKRQRGIVEQVRELTAVSVFIRRVAKLAKLEEVAAEQKGMPRLSNRHVGPWHRLALLVHHHNRPVRLAMLLDPSRRALPQVVGQCSTFNHCI